MSLRIDWCSHQAAKYAVEHWHYSKSLPGADLVKIGVWENGVFIGCVIFSRGATPQIASPYGLKPTDMCELTRVALTNHETSVSRIIAISLRFLKKQCPRLKMIVSFADSEQGHHGGIYQAGGWFYTGTTKPGRVGFIVNGKKTHTRSIGSLKGGVQSLDWVKSHLDPKATIWEGSPKHRYLMPLDKEMRKKIEPLSKPYPKRSKGLVSVPSDGGQFNSDPTAPELQ